MDGQKVIGVSSRWVGKLKCLHGDAFWRVKLLIFFLSFRRSTSGLNIENQHFSASDIMKKKSYSTRHWQTNRLAIAEPKECKTNLILPIKITRSMQIINDQK